MSNPTLDSFLSELEKRAPQSRIDLGLTRVSAVYARLFDRDVWSDTRIITVGGTNGKGSTVAFCEAIGQAAGLRTAAYTSPHLVQFNERLRLDGQMAPSSEWLDALESVETAREDIALSWFEHVTLAAWVIAAKIKPELLILEVGLGGRLDAVNVISPDVAVITSIGLDHTDWLGPTRSHIGREKLGIARAQKPIIVGEQDWPGDLEEILTESQARSCRIGRDFWITDSEADPSNGWYLACADGAGFHLPAPQLLGSYQKANAACAVLAIMSAFPDISWTEDCLSLGLIKACVPGRFEQVQTRPVVILDVAHNPDGAQALAQTLRSQKPTGGSGSRTLAVFSSLVDKDVEGIALAMNQAVDHWFIGDLDGPRGQTATQIQKRLENCGVHKPIEALKSIPVALDRALDHATPQDRVVIFGSFHVIGEVRSRWIEEE